MEITSEIFQIGGSEISSAEDAAIYIAHFDNQAALIDAGCGRSLNTILNNIAACGVSHEQIKYILLTHCHFDHTGGAKKLRDKMCCEIIAHELDAIYLEQGDNVVTAASWYGTTLASFTIDKKISGTGENISLGTRTIEAIHAPGHSPGSMVFLAESDGKRVLFGQDIHGPLDPSLLSNPQDYKKSLEQLIGLNADILCEGHFGVITGRNEVVRFIRSFL